MLICMRSSVHPMKKLIKRMRSGRLKSMCPVWSTSWANSLKSLMVSNSANIFEYTTRKSGEVIMFCVACSYGLGKMNCEVGGVSVGGCLCDTLIVL